MIIENIDGKINKWIDEKEKAIWQAIVDKRSMAGFKNYLIP